jgi:hypothetical protein
MLIGALISALVATFGSAVWTIAYRQIADTLRRSRAARCAAGLAQQFVVDSARLLRCPRPTKLASLCWPTRL